MSEEGLSPAEEAEEVLKVLMRDGTFDELRKMIVDDLKENASLRAYAEAKVADSDVLRARDAERRPRKELFAKLRAELEEVVLEKAAKAAWASMTAPAGSAGSGRSTSGSAAAARAIPDLIDMRVHEALCQLQQEQQQQPHSAAARR